MMYKIRGYEGIVNCKWVFFWGFNLDSIMSEVWLGGLMIGLWVGDFFRIKLLKFELVD